MQTKAENHRNVSLTSFIDFVLKSGSSKMTCARQIKDQEKIKYHPIRDYYKRFREAVQELHQQQLPKSALPEIIGDLPKRKQENYQLMIEGYGKFLGRRKVQWFKPLKKHWKNGSLRIPINPELGLEWDGTKYLIKLYLKAEKPSKDRLGSVLALMKHTFRSHGYVYAVLDVRNSKLFLYEASMDALMPLVEGEARSLELILNQLSK